MFHSHLPALGEIRTCIFLLSSCSRKNEANIHTTNEKKVRTKIHTPTTATPRLASLQLGLAVFLGILLRENSSGRIGESEKIREKSVDLCWFLAFDVPKSFQNYIPQKRKWMMKECEAASNLCVAPCIPRNLLNTLFLIYAVIVDLLLLILARKDACVQYWKWMKMSYNLHSWPLEWGKWSLTRQSRHDPWVIAPDPTWTSRQTLCAFW